MSNDMFTSAFALGIPNAISSMLQTRGASILSHGPDHILQGVESIVLNGYDVVSRYITRAAHRTAPPGEPVTEEPETLHNARAIDTGGETDGTVHQPFPLQDEPIRLQGSPPALDDENPEHVTHPVDEVEQFAVDPPLARPRKCTWVWLSILITGVLLLVAVPGLVIGVVTKQLDWGIALSGLLVAVAGFFAGLYYHVSTSGGDEVSERRAGDLEG